MKVGNPQYRGDEVPLPIEVLDLICHFVKTAQHAKSQSTLAAGTLVSKSWCSIFTRHLYEQPLIVPGNFDAFTRTICTTVTAKTKRVGLETYVKHLDLSKIAYESSKSLTARLIGRTSHSLEYFAAPAITFGIGSLAPLSKSLNLRVLDLSHDGYQIKLNRILDSVSRLEHLIELRLPTDAAGDGAECHFPTGCWPKRLEVLQLSLKMCIYVHLHVRWWDEFLSSLPASLGTLIIPDFLSYHSFYICKDIQVSAKSITRLELGRAKDDDCIAHLPYFLACFPSLTTLTVPVTIRIALADLNLDHWFDDDMWETLYHPGGALANSDQSIQRNSLVKELTFSLPPTSVAFGFHGSINMDVFFLKAIVASFPLLQRVNIPIGSIKILDEDDNQDELQEICQILESRAPSDESQYAGIFQD
ncbi:hypothetical protein LTR84_001133 [Exophiala bonariae]|uniref:F-box domain-containing protein n=1 Tax=Exophiala bonariae TaxID=1690606 RepID=A0AAV9NWH9_9EURO|nr:hypothetical protein LTR84_001133 [Exophiala bonariae]